MSLEVEEPKHDCDECGKEIGMRGKCVCMVCVDNLVEINKERGYTKGYTDAEKEYENNYIPIPKL